MIFDGAYFIGHSGEYFPYCYRNRFTNQLEGVYLHVWTLLERQTGATFTPKFYVYDSSSSVDNLTFDGLMGAVLRGNLLTAFEGSILTAEMTKLFRYTVPFYQATISLYETRRLTHGGHPSSYIVYPQDLLFLFLAIVIASSIVETIRHILLKKQNRPYERRGGPFIMLLPPIFLVLTIHNAGYSGNSLMKVPEATSYSMFMTEMMSGQRQFITEEKYLITMKSEFEHFRGPHSAPYAISQSIFERFERLCANPEYVSAIFSLDLATLAAIPGVCTLMRIPTEPRKPGLVVLDDPMYYVMIFGKNHSTRGMVKMANKIMLRLFREEQMYDIWIPRFARTPTAYIWGDRNPTKGEMKYDSFKYSNLDHLMPIIYSLYGLAILVFFIELIGYHTRVRCVRCALDAATAAARYFVCVAVPPGGR